MAVNLLVYYTRANRNFRVNIVLPQPVDTFVHMAHSIAERIRSLREERGWTKGELARRVGGGNPRTAVSLWESGSRVPTRSTVERLAEIFGVSPTEVDPAGQAFEAKGRRRKPRLQKSYGPADTSIVAPHVPPEAGVLMNGGSSLNDPDLFDEVLGAWKLLREERDRRQFVNHVREYMAGYLSPTRSHRKNSRR